MSNTNHTTSTAEAVLAALADGATSAAEVAEQAGIGRSTATKALAALADQGQGHPEIRWARRRPPSAGQLVTSGRQDEAADSVGERLAEPSRQKASWVAWCWPTCATNRGEHSPTAVAKALDGRSSGAVGNALARLVEAGDAVQTSEAPRRYKAKKR